ncbi:sulfite exporter TauE/SafE family protein [Actibacterium ureilyticum]|uniref:sulfite exporter TauE/SafE family protein n=1 Tax=Actibacterium ureilyticum TaxID=1590614 RepID=UPI000BAB1CA5|nr:sulfite exporter TauE/SafE family protein [Actibacterium ureilyticum]
MLFFALAIPAVVFAGVSKAGFGSGAAFAATPILALILDPAMALGMMLPLLMLVDAVTLRPYWRQWDWRSSRHLILGAVPGVALGAFFYTAADPDLLRLFIGGMAIAFVLFQLSVRMRWLRYRVRPFHHGVGMVAGLFAGFSSFVSHAGGPPVAVYLLAQGQSKTVYQATSVLVFWAINLTKFVPYVFLGIFTADTLRADLYLAPFALLGAWLGVKAHRLVPERAFFILTYVLLIVTGSKLIWDALG